MEENHEEEKMLTSEEVREKFPDEWSDYFVVVNPQPRWKSWAVWVSVIGAVWTILNAFGLPQKWGIEEGTFKNVVDAVGVILIGFGILNNPTDKDNF